MKTLTLKQKKFVEVTAKTLNPTEGARQAYNLRAKDKKTISKATTVAHQNMTNYDIKESIAEKIENNLSVKGVNYYHERNIKQTKNPSASNQALDMFYKLRGDYAPEKKININVNADNIDKRIKELQDELNLQPQT